MKEFKFKIDGKDYEAKVAEQDNGVLAVTLNGNTYAVEVPALAHHAAKPVVHHAAAPAAASHAAPAAAPAAAGRIVAPLPGTIKQVLVSDGQKVKQGDTVITMEAMKMENAITAEADGIILKVRTSVGASVNQGDVLVDFQAEGKAAAAQKQPAPHSAPEGATAPKAATAKATEAPSGAVGGASHTVEAPLPGTIKQVCVSVGQEVAAGETVVVMEAMKMENNITAEFAGKVAAVKVNVGDQVQSGQALVELA